MSTIKADTVTASTTDGDVTIQGNGTGTVAIGDNTAITGTLSSTSTATLSGLAYPSDGGLWTGRNLIINSEMKVSQRGTSFAPLTNDIYSLDRWQYYTAGAGVITGSQATDTPNGNFKNSLKADVTTADASVAAGDLSTFLQKIEGLDCSALGWGTAQAKSITVSFWVKSPKTGTHSIALRNSAQDRSYVAEYTIDSADTWEQQSITVAGDTSGTWLTTNGVGLQWNVLLMAGTTFTTTAGSWGAGNYYGSGNQVNCLDSTSNDFYFTGVQLEVGSAATPFEHEMYGTTLQKCLRYYQKPVNWWAQSDGSTATAFKIFHSFPVTMRAAPTVGTTGTPACVKMNANAAGPTTISVVPTANVSGFNSASYTTMATGGGSAAATNTPYSGTNGFTADAEL